MINTPAPTKSPPVYLKQFSIILSLFPWQHGGAFPCDICLAHWHMNMNIFANFQFKSSKNVKVIQPQKNFYGSKLVLAEVHALMTCLSHWHTNMKIHVKFQVNFSNSDIWNFKFTFHWLPWQLGNTNSRNTYYSHRRNIINKKMWKLFNHRRISMFLSSLPWQRGGACTINTPAPSKSPPVYISNNFLSF